MSGVEIPYVWGVAIGPDHTTEIWTRFAEPVPANHICDATSDKSDADSDGRDAAGCQEFLTINPSYLNILVKADAVKSHEMLSVLRKARLKDKEMRVLMLGLDNAGKTTIVKKIMNEDVHSVSPTLGFIIKTIDFEGYKLNIWDVGGQKTLRSYWKNYFEKTDALIWVVDATDRLRIQDCREELAGLLLEERLMGATLLVFANKTDVEGSMTDKQIREDLQLDLIKTHTWAIFRCSAMTGINLTEGLHWVVEDAKQKLFLY